MLDGPLPEMVEHLIAGDPPRTGDGEGLFEIGNVEVAHPPSPDLARSLEIQEPRDGFLQRMMPGQCSR